MICLPCFYNEKEILTLFYGAFDYFRKIYLLGIVNGYIDLFQVIEEHFMEKGVNRIEARTIAVQVSEQLFTRLKNVVAWKGCKQKEFLISVIEKAIGEVEEEIIIDSTQITIFGGFAPNSSSADVLSKALGSRTVMSGSVSRGKNDPSQSLQMIERPLMTPDELKSMPKGQFCEEYAVEENGNFVFLKVLCYNFISKE